MKKLAFLLAALLMISVCFVACNNTTDGDDDDQDGGKTPGIVDDGEDDTTAGNNGGDGGEDVDPEITYTFTDVEHTNVYALKALNLREQPSFASSVAKLSVPAETGLLKIAESNETSIDSNGHEYKWFKVIHEEKEYYVKSILVTAISDPDAGFTSLSKTLYAKGTLKVRAVPSTENEEVGYIAVGAAIKIIAVNEESGWYKIEFEGKYTPKGEYYVTSDAKYWSETPIDTDDSN